MTAPRETPPALALPASLSGFRWRLISSVVLWAILLAVVFWLPPTALYVFMNIVLAVATWEFYRICEVRGVRTYKVWGTLGTVALISGSWFVFGMERYRRPTDFPALAYEFDILILVVFALGVFLRAFPQKDNPEGIVTMAVTLLGLVYVAWLGNFITRINFSSVHGRYLVMYLVVVTKFTDIGAYLVGSTLGRHKMIPRISPKKTWEGTAGGLLFALVASVLMVWAMPATLGASGLTMTHAVVLGLVLGAAAVVGDLAESLVKREAGVKDSGTILPGHGGALDLVDSLLFTGPLLYVYLRLFVG